MHSVGLTFGVATTARSGIGEVKGPSNPCRCVVTPALMEVGQPLTVSARADCPREAGRTRSARPGVLAERTASMPCCCRALAVLLAAFWWSAIPPQSTYGVSTPEMFLCPPAPLGRDLPTGLREKYVPHEGDLFFFSDHSVFWRWVYMLAWTGPPFHVGIVARLPDGRPALLEAGPFDSSKVYLFDMFPRLKVHDGEIWVRRLRCPLTADQSASLTQFALEQAGKPFALGRVMLEGTPIRNHGFPNAQLFGRPWIDRQRWFCSELTIAAAAHVGVIDPNVIRPNTVYPRDLFLDAPHDLSPWWEEPRRWTSEPGAKLQPVRASAPGATPRYRGHAASECDLDHP
jgi:hypothetical protein